MGIFRGHLTAEGRLELDFPNVYRAYLRRFPADTELEVELRKRSTKRTLRQNSAFHALITPWAHELGVDPDDLKRDLLALTFGTKEVVSGITGEVRQVPVQPHSSHLTVPEFVQLMDRTMEIAAGCGYVMQAPEEHRLAKAALNAEAA
jgi:hypothetical protein